MSDDVRHVPAWEGGPTTVVERASTGRAALATVLLFAAGAGLAQAFLPVALLAAGLGPVGIGLCAGFVLAADAVLASLPTEQSRLTTLAVGGCASLGATAWVLVPALAPLLAGATAVTGTVAVRAWRPADGTAAGTHGWRLALAAVFAGLLAATGTVTTGFSVFAGLVAAVGVTAVVVAGVVDTPTVPRTRERPGRLRPPSALGWAVAELTTSQRRALTATVLVRTAEAAIGTFLVVWLLAWPRPTLALAGTTLGPASTAALVLGVVSLGALVGHHGRARLVARFGPESVLAAAALVVTVVPLLLAGPATEPLSILAVLGCYGLRHGAEPLRARLLDGQIGALATPAPPWTRGLGTLVVALGPALGGVLYALSPTLLFSAAGAVGLLAVHQYVHLFGWQPGHAPGGGR
ncbi:hypothetical protein [Haloarchaeobius amylolyticus]|uniref:hypothetical protein n=1 Tax=Haloarchaeobius amylolyticus TaxID=1198296 RepID=UPI0022718429|nr:hypothetical protein [Haloarchaeobius amylolyticus]